MYVCVSECFYVSPYVYDSVCISACMYVFVSARARVWMRMCERMCVWVSTYVSANACVSLCVCVMCVYLCVRACVHWSRIEDAGCIRGRICACVCECLCVYIIMIYGISEHYPSSPLDAIAVFRSLSSEDRFDNFCWWLKLLTGQGIVVFHWHVQKRSLKSTSAQW